MSTKCVGSQVFLSNLNGTKDAPQQVDLHLLIWQIFTLDTGPDTTPDESVSPPRSEDQGSSA